MSAKKQESSSDPRNASAIIQLPMKGGYKSLIFQDATVSRAGYQYSANSVYSALKHGLHHNVFVELEKLFAEAAMDKDL